MNRNENINQENLDNKKYERSFKKLTFYFGYDNFRDYCQCNPDVLTKEFEEIQFNSKKYLKNYKKTYEDYNYQQYITDEEIIKCLAIGAEEGYNQAKVDLEFQSEFNF